MRVDQFLSRVYASSTSKKFEYSSHLKDLQIFLIIEQCLLTNENTVWRSVGHLVANSGQSAMANYFIAKLLFSRDELENAVMQEVEKRHPQFLHRSLKSAACFHDAELLTRVIRLAKLMVKDSAEQGFSVVSESTILKCIGKGAQHRAAKYFRNKKNSKRKHLVFRGYDTRRAKVDPSERHAFLYEIRGSLDASRYVALLESTLFGTKLQRTRGLKISEN